MVDKRKRWCVIPMIICIWASNACTEEPRYLPYSEVVKLSPQMRSEPLTAKLYSINAGKLAMYLNNILIFDSKDDFEELPYIVAFDRDESMGNVGDIAYTAGLNTNKGISSYSTVLMGEQLTHPDTGEDIGVEAFVTGNAIIQQDGNPQTVLLTKVAKAIDLNTRLTPSVGIDMPAVIDVKYPDKMISGYILSVQADEVGGGGYSTAVISLGQRDGIKQGYVFDIKEGERARTDQYTDKEINLPASKIGELLVYKVDRKTSLAIITYSDRMITPLDMVYVPQGF